MCFACLGNLGRNLPARVVELGCTAAAFAEMRRRVVPDARGMVVEIGFGSGHSLPFYDRARVSRVIGIEPDAAMRDRAGPNLRASRVPVDLIDARGEATPLPAGSADTVVMGYVLCSVTDPLACLGEAARLLRPGGRLLFCEHGVADTGSLERIQHLLDGVWGRLAAGCSLLRDPLAMLQEAGFRCGDVHRDRFSGLLGILGRHVGGWAEHRPGA